MSKFNLGLALGLIKRSAVTVGRHANGREVKINYIVDERRERIMVMYGSLSAVVFTYDQTTKSYKVP